MIGSIELLQVLGSLLKLHGTLFDFIDALDFGTIGYIIVSLFLLAWILSVSYWKLARVQERYDQRDQQLQYNGLHFHQHTHSKHDDGVCRSHTHLH